MKKVITAILMVFMWGDSIANTKPVPLFERWLKNTSDFFGAQKLDERKSQVIFYREAGAIEGPAVNIYIDGAYHASLLENHYKKIELCAQTHLFSTAFSSRTGFADKERGIYFTLPSKQSSFIKITHDANGQPAFERVDAQTGKKAILRLPTQEQTLSRVIPAHECKEKIVLQNFALSAKTLFLNGRSDQAGMMPEGKAELLDLATDLKRLDQRHISHIVISGHSAPGEASATSKKLSANRAKTVLNLLQREGIKFPMEVTGYGAQQQLSQNCAERNPDDHKMREACDQANRRVEVTVYAIQ